MTNAQLVEKLLTLPPNDQATLSFKDATGLTTTRPALWVAKGSIYSKAEAVRPSHESHIIEPAKSF